MQRHPGPGGLHQPQHGAVLRLQAPVVSTLVPFDPAESKFSVWVQLFEEFCFLNNIPEEQLVPEGEVPPHNRKRALFLSHVGTRALEVLTKRATPMLPNQFPLAVLINTLQQYYEKPELQSTYRYQLMSRIQMPQESLEDYIANLQELAGRCGFGAWMDDRLRDRFISGANLPTAVRSHLLAHPQLSYDEMTHYALNAARMEEQTKMYVRNLQLQQVAIGAVQHLEGGSQKQGTRQFQRQQFQPAFQNDSAQFQRQQFQPALQNDNVQFQRQQVQQVLPPTPQPRQQWQQPNQQPVGGFQQSRAYQQPVRRQAMQTQAQGIGPGRNPLQQQWLPEPGRNGNANNSTGCYRSGRPHDSNTCGAVNLQCNFCKKMGHIMRVCRSRQAQQGGLQAGRAVTAPDWQQNHWVGQTPMDQRDPPVEEWSEEGIQRPIDNYSVTVPSADSQLPINNCSMGIPAINSPSELGSNVPLQEEMAPGDPDDAVVDAILRQLPQYFVGHVSVVDTTDEILSEAKRTTVLPVDVMDQSEEDFAGDLAELWFTPEEMVAEAVADLEQELDEILLETTPEPGASAQWVNSEVSSFGQQSAEQEAAIFNNTETGKGDLSPPEVVEVSIEGIPVQMEVDSGAGVSLATRQTYQEKFAHIPLQPAPVKLKGVSAPIVVAGCIHVRVKFPGSVEERRLTLVIVETTDMVHPLLGRTWLDEWKPGWRGQFRTEIPSNQVTFDVQNLQERFAPVFDQKNDAPIKGFKAAIVLKEGYTPVFHGAYPVPYATIPIYDAKLTSLINKGSIYPVRFSDWASPCILVDKKGDKTQIDRLDPIQVAETSRLCVDFKKTVNKWTETDHYKMPVPADMFAAMAGGVVFTVLDLSDAYTQLELDEVSQELLTIYGLNCAPSIFQRTMDCILQGIDGVFCYIDDILIKGASFQECLKTVCQVLRRLEQYNVRLKPSKCVWFATEVEYLGHVLSASGRRPAPSKVACIEAAPAPKNVKQVRSLLGLIEFYSDYLPHRSTILKPLSQLTHLHEKFNWDSSCDQALNTIKAVIKDKVLIHYDPALPIVLLTDASPVGLGVALCHEVKENGRRKEKPILFASCTLTERQMNYAQIDREALAVIFGVTRCHKYIYGRKFTIATDNSAISHIFSPKKGLPVHAANRLINWAYILEAYSFNIEHRKAELLAVPDALSRLPAEGEVHVMAVPTTVGLPLTFLEIAQETSRDPVLSKVKEFVYRGWPKATHPQLTDEIKPYFQRRQELNIVENCLLRADRVIIPASLQAHVLKLLHIGHPGKVRTKLAAKRVVYWLGMDTDIDTFLENCGPCQLANFKPSMELIPWPAASYPFERVHIDFCQLQSVHYFVLCDTYSKWVHACVMARCTAAAVIDELWSLFAVWGFPNMIVADNGAPFDSKDFTELCTSYNISLLHSPPQHPQSNGPGERAVQIVKKALRKIDESKDRANPVTVAMFLFAYRNTPSTATMKSPNEMLFTFRPKTLISQLNPVLNPKNKALLRNELFREGETVKLQCGKQPAVLGKVVRRLSETRYLVSVQGVLKKPHINQMTPVSPAMLNTLT